MDEVNTKIEMDFDYMSDTPDGLPGVVLWGLRDVQGTFSGPLNDALTAAFAAESGNPVEVYLYGPDPHMSRVRYWFYRIREAVTGRPLPTVVLAHGPASFTATSEEEDGDDVVITGHFTNKGVWEIKP